MRRQRCRSRECRTQKIYVVSLLSLSAQAFAQTSDYINLAKWAAKASWVKKSSSTAFPGFPKLFWLDMYRFLVLQA